METAGIRLQSILEMVMDGFLSLMRTIFIDSAVEFKGEIPEKDKEGFRKKVIYTNPAMFAATVLYRHIITNILSTNTEKAVSQSF